MNKNKLEQYIKEQLEQEEYEVSTDTWKKLEAKLDGSYKKRNRPYRWIWVAAAIVLIGFFCFLAFNHPTTDTAPVKNEYLAEKHSTIYPAKKTFAEDVREKPVRIETGDFREEEGPIAKKLPVMAVPEHEQKLLKTHFKSSEIISQKPLIANHAFEIKETPQILSDAVMNNPKTEKNYVDENMLLFSVENKDMVKQAQDHSHGRLVIIDFNK